MFKPQDKWACLCDMGGTHLSKVPSWAKHLAKDFTSQSESAPAKTYPASHKACLKRDKNTYTSDKQQKLIELSSFNHVLDIAIIAGYQAWSSKRFTSHYYSSLHSDKHNWANTS
jgi:hypothetical protein